MTETYYPVQGRITVYSHNDHRKPLRITATALTNLTGEVHISYWKINDARTEITLTIEQDGPNHLNAYRGEQIDRTYPVEIKETPLPSPGRSFEWSNFSRCWIHKKTGVRVINA